MATNMKAKYVTVVCATCKVEITGRINRFGELRAARQPKNDAPRIAGYCMLCVPHAQRVRLLGRDLWNVDGVVPPA